MSSISGVNCVSFRGHGTETTGSIAKRNQPVECPTCGRVNFKGSEYGEEKKKGAKKAGVIGGLVALTAASIIGLGYAHKTKCFEKLGEGWKKTAFGWLEPAGKKCHEWCALGKRKTRLGWQTVKGWFGKGTKA